MVLERVLSMLTFMPRAKNDDFVDRLHYFWSSNFLLAMMVLVSWKTFGGSPIECIFPKAFPHSWEEYAEKYCWSQDTYFVAPDEYVANIDVIDRQASERKLSYYQWVPFFLLFEAACFRLPSLVWKYLAGHSGIRIHEIVKMAVDPNNINPECKKNNIATLTTHLQNALRFQQRIKRKGVTPHKVIKFLNLSYSAHFVTFIYLVTKLLYLVNVILQLHAMNRFLETNKYNWYGFGVVQDILNGTQWDKSGSFPRVSICDFEVRQVGNIHTFSVQCLLVVNIFNEKIFLLLWFWYMLLMVATLLSFFYWSFVMVLPWFGKWFIIRNLELSEMPFDPQGLKSKVNCFVNRYLRSDGVFVLRIITMNAGIIFGADLVLALWKAFHVAEQQLHNDHPNECPIKSDDANSMLRLRRKNKKNEDFDDCDDAVVAEFAAATKLHRSNSSQLPLLEENERKGKRSTAPPKPSLFKSSTIAQAPTLGSTGFILVPPPILMTNTGKRGMNEKTIKDDEGSQSTIQL